MDNSLILKNCLILQQIPFPDFYSLPFSLLPRIGKPEDCAGIVSFLCSEDADYITGETVVVAGGALSHL